MRLNRLISQILTRLRAYDFEPEWEDLRQDVILAVVEAARRGSIRDPAAIVGYVWTITRNTFADRLERRIKFREKESVPWLDMAERTPQPGGDPSPGDNPTTDIWIAARDLPEKQRAILRGLYREGKTYEDVSRDEDIPLGSLKRELRRAIATLRARFQVGGLREGA